MKRKTNIELNIDLDENSLPEKITWNAPDGGVSGQEAGAFFLSLWDKQTASSMRVELWEKDMLVDDMKQFIHQSMISLSETYEKATGQFCLYFAEKAGIIDVPED